MTFRITRKPKNFAGDVVLPISYDGRHVFLDFLPASWQARFVAKGVLRDYANTSTPFPAAGVAFVLPCDAWFVVSADGSVRRLES